MKCISTPTTTNPGPCVPCIHPFEYLVELAYLGSDLNGKSSASFDISIDRLLDKGITIPSCKYCCPDCYGVYALASVETMLKLFEAVGITLSAAPPASPLSAVDIGAFGQENLQLECCSNIVAGTETLLMYSEAIGETTLLVPALPKGAFLEGDSEDNPFLKKCCNGFDECIDDLFCWVTQYSKQAANDIDRIMDKGIVEYGSIVNNCTGATSSSVCKLVSLFEKYLVGVPNSALFGTSQPTRSELIDRILDKGIVISCDEYGNSKITSVETWLKYAEGFGFTEGGQVPASPEQTTTTTTVA